MMSEMECRGAYASLAQGDRSPHISIGMGWALDGHDYFPVLHVKSLMVMDIKRPR